MSITIVNIFGTKQKKKKNNAETPFIYLFGVYNAERVVDFQGGLQFIEVSRGLISIQTSPKLFLLLFSSWVNKAADLFHAEKLGEFVLLEIIEMLVCDDTRHHQQGRWQARIGRVAGNKDLYLGTFSKLTCTLESHCCVL